MNSNAGPEFEMIDLSVTSASEQQVWVSAVSRLGAVHGVRREAREIQLDELKACTEHFRGKVEGAYRDRSFSQKAGALLRDLVFGVSGISALFNKTRGAAADRGRPLLVRLMAAPQSIASLPWELILDPEGGPHQHLTLAPDAHIVRLARIRTYPVRLTPLPKPLRMLLILSSPLGTVNSKGVNELIFDLYEEKRALLNELDSLISDGLLKVDVEDRPTIENLRRRVASRQKGYNLIHYIGHGLPGQLLLEDSSGMAAKTEAKNFNAVLRHCPELRLVFFAGCQTAQSSNVEDELWQDSLSLADLCVRDACQVVIGMQAVLPFPTERLFCRFFYQGLTSGRTIADSISLARAATYDDEQVGQGKLDWAVPCIFIGGESPGQLIDIKSPPVPIKSRQREELKLDLEEGEREFFSRHVQLRETIDFLAGRSRHRVLWVTGPAGVGKTRLVGRALDDVQEPIEFVLYVPLGRLLGSDDPVKNMCELVVELLSRRDNKLRTRDPAWSGNDWWERLIEEVVHLPIAIGIDDFDLIEDESASDMRNAIEKLIRRRTQARLILIAKSIRPDLVPAAEGRGAHVNLQPLGWDAVWRWIRRNRPVLTRFDQPALVKYFGDLGSQLENWDALADELERDGKAKLSQLVARIRPQMRAMPGIRTERPRKQEPTGVRVACAGPDIEGRQSEFASAMTMLAVKHEVAGRVAAGLFVDPSSPIASLLAIPSPFNDLGTSDTEGIKKWFEAAMEAKADIVLADFDASKQSKDQDDMLDEMVNSGVLVLAAGGNAKDPIYPAWNPNVLAIGPLDDSDQIASYAFWDPKHRKPDIFAPEHVRGTPLEAVVKTPSANGSSYAALHGVIAAVLVWATDRRQEAADVRQILESTAEPLSHSKRKRRHSPRRLNLPRALECIRRQLLKAALTGGPLQMQKLVAATGLAPNVTLRIIDEMVSKGELVQSRAGKMKIYEIAPP